METAITACPLDCPDTCTLQVTVRDGRLIGVDAAPAGVGNPFTRGWICAKVRRHARRVHGPDRVLTPLVRTGPKGPGSGSGSFRAVSWDEALDRTARAVREAIDRHGPASVVPFLYNSSAGARADRLTVRLFAELGASRVAHTICAATAGVAWHGTFPNMSSADPLDLCHSDLVVIWGANPSTSNTHLTPLLAQARRRGAPLVVIDPRRTPTAASADLHLPVRPGTDAALGLALATELDRSGLLDRSFCDRHAEGVEEYLAAARAWDAERAAVTCGVAAGDIRDLALLVGTRRPAMLRIGWGVERNRNGASSIRSGLALWVLAGQFGQPGAGIIQSTSRDSGIESDDGREGPLPAPSRVLNMNHLGRDLLGADPPVSVLFVQGANPAVMAPDQQRVLAGLARADLFCVVHDQVMTDTAAQADLVLPATTHFEAADVADSYGTFTLSPMPAVIPRVGEAWTNDELAAALAERLGLSGFDPALPPGPTEHTSTRPAGTVQFGDPGDPATTMPDGTRARLVLGSGPDRVPVHRDPEEDDAHPLTLLSPASARSINSILSDVSPATAEVRVNSSEARSRAIGDGDLVEVYNDLGRIRLPVRVDDGVRQGVAVIPKGLWRRHVEGGLTANALIADDVEATVGGACFNDARVEIAAVRGPAS